MAARTIAIFTTGRSVRSLSALLLRTGRRSQSGMAGVLESPWPPVDIPEESIPEFVWAKTKFHDKPAISCGVTGRSYTFGQAREMTRRFAWSLLADRSLAKGDRVGILLPNIPEYLVAIHGVIEAGMIPTFVNPLYTADEVGRQFLNAGVKTCITIPELLPTMTTVASQLFGYSSTIVVGGATSHDPTKNQLSFRQLLREAQPAEVPTLSPDDLAVLPYSSGTTGLPKGVMLSHRNLIGNVMQTDIPDINHFNETTGDTQDVALTMLPYFHIYGFNGVLNTTLRHSVHLVSIPRFVPEDYIGALVKFRPRCLFVVPSLLVFLANHPAVTRDHLASVDTVISGAAAATRSLVDNFRAKVGRDDITVRQGFGMTEASPVITFSSLNDKSGKEESVGFLLPSTYMKVVDIDTNEPQGPNKPGEVWVRGPQVMSGYLNNEEATNETIDSDRWLHTGDVGYYDTAGFLFIVDRTKELIKVKGNQVSPTELENIITQIPGVIDVAVVGVPDEASGEIPRAFVVCRPGVVVTEQEIVDYVRPKVAPYKRLTGGVTMIDSIPRNPSGKVLRHQLKALCTAG